MAESGRERCPPHPVTLASEHARSVVAGTWNPALWYWVGKSRKVRRSWRLCDERVTLPYQARRNGTPGGILISVKVARHQNMISGHARVKEMAVPTMLARRRRGTVLVRARVSARLHNLRRLAILYGGMKKVMLDRSTPRPRCTNRVRGSRKPLIGSTWRPREVARATKYGVYVARRCAEPSRSQSSTYARQR